QALQIEPTQARANFMMGLIAFRRGRLEEALNFFGSMPPGAGNNYSVYRNTALILEMLGRYDEALQVLDG
ncbi:MAG: tetratricopeptide repeat protein, partial [Longimicrobiales bacterium]